MLKSVIWTNDSYKSLLKQISIILLKFDENNQAIRLYRLHVHLHQNACEKGKKIQEPNGL